MAFWRPFETDGDSIVTEGHRVIRSKFIFEYSYN